MSVFHDVRLPLAFSLGARGGPVWKTQVSQLSSGREFRNASWASSRRRWDVGGGLQSRTDIEALVAFFEARRGRLYAFRFRDVTDWKSCNVGQEIAATDQMIARGDGETRSFQLVKRYVSGNEERVRKITRPVAQSVRVEVDGAEMLSGWSIETDTGSIVFETAPESGTDIRAGYEFDLPVRFDSDALNISMDQLNAGRFVSVPVIEILE